LNYILVRRNTLMKKAFQWNRSTPADGRRDRPRKTVYSFVLV
jgi:hypothetical protein